MCELTEFGVPVLHGQHWISTLVVFSLRNLSSMRLLVLLTARLLASAPLSDAQHVNFYRMSSNGCATGVKSDTGYSAPVIKYVWRKYRAQLINAARGYEGFRFVVNEGDDALAEYVGLCLYAALWYMHIYPTVAAIGGWEFHGRRSYVEREWLLCRDLSWLSCLGGAEASLASLGGTRSKPRRR